MEKHSKIAENVAPTVQLCVRKLNNVDKLDNYITQTHKLHEAIDQFTVE